METQKGDEDEDEQAEYDEEDYDDEENDEDNDYGEDYYDEDRDAIGDDEGEYAFLIMVFNSALTNDSLSRWW